MYSPGWVAQLVRAPPQYTKVMGGLISSQGTKKQPNECMDGWNKIDVSFPLLKNMSFKVQKHVSGNQWAK